MVHCDLYGTRILSALDSKLRIEVALNASLEVRESLFHGGVYYKYKNNSESFMIKNNYDLIDDHAAERLFADYPVLLYVDSTERSLELSFKILGDGAFVLLRHEVL